MKKLFFYFFLIFLFTNSFGQKVPRFSKIAISNSGCFAYFPGTPTNFNASFSEDSSIVYTGSFDFDGYTFGIVSVKFARKTGANNEELENLLIAYMDYLKTFFDISSTAGYGKGHTLESNPDAIGILDYWEDKSGNQLNVKAWVDHYYLGFMYLLGKTEYPNINIVQLFQNGFRFPEK